MPSFYEDVALQWLEIMNCTPASPILKDIPNRYSNLVYTLPQYIIPGHGGGQQEKEALLNLNRKIEKYPKIALEYGSGSGEHLLKQAQNNPEVLFVGFELRYKRTYRTAEKAIEQKIENLFVIRSDARKAPEYFSLQSVSTIFINFPDPWWKKRRWKKHRLVDKNLLNQAANLLMPGGTLRYKTDHQEYFKDVLQLLEKESKFQLEQHTFDLQNSNPPADNILSEFEKLFIYKQVPICFLKAVRH
jgi:tRNA (guanine-N7-)-methyltransferase